MKKNFLANFLVLITVTSFAQIKVTPVQTDRAPNTNVQNINIPKKQVAFRLTLYSAGTLPSNANTALNVSLKEFDLANNTRGTSFVAPETGIYHFDVNLNFSPQLTDYGNYLRFHLMLLKGGAEIERTSLMSPQTQLTPFHTLRISTNILLKAGESVSAAYLGDANPNTTAVNVTSASFSGFKVADMEAGGAPSGIR